MMASVGKGWMWLGALVLAGVAGTSLAAADTSFARVEGLNLNSFVRQGNVAAHILLRNGSDPRLIVAFPAGNSGVGLWFKTLGKPAEWSMSAPAP